MNTEIAAIDAGIDAANPQQAREAREVKKWLERIDKTRKFDEEALKQYAVDRRYARGDSGFAVDDNIIGTFIDILVAFLYAKNPDVDVLPSKSTEPPSIEAIRDAAELDIDTDPELQLRIVGAGQAAALAPPPNPLDVVADSLVTGQPPMPPPTPEEAMLAEREAIITERFDAMQAAYRKRQRDNKAFAETLELVIARLWMDAKLKLRARQWCRSGLTIAVGWMKASWQERMGQDPLTVQKIADLRDNIAKAAALKGQMEDAAGEDLDAKLAEYNDQLAALQGEAERVLARGFVIDPVNGEDMTVAPGVEIARYLDAPWIDHRIPMRVDDIVAEFKLDKDKAAKITRYCQRKPVLRRDESPGASMESVEAKDADQFTEGDSGEVGEWGMVHETWDRDANCIRTMVEGLDCYVRAPYAPVATSRFYGFFLFALGDVDGQRHPQSLTARSAKLVDEYYRIRSAERDHRARVKPKTLFRKGQINGDTMTVIVNGESAEFVGVETTNPNAPLGDIFHVVEYPALDRALYDTSPIVHALERLWGVQEALAGGVQVEKTLGEAEIQEAGRQARTGSQRDVLEDALSDLAVFTAEVALAKLSAEDVREIVGPDAMWPEYSGPDDLRRMVNVEIRAGSSGKPNTSAERQAWAALQPMLQAGIERIAALRGSAPADVADSIERLLRMTAERSGDRIDIDALLPPAGAMPLLPGPGGNTAPGADPAAGGEPIQEPTPPVAA